MVVSFVGCPARSVLPDNLTVVSFYRRLCLCAFSGCKISPSATIDNWASFLIVQSSYLICCSCVETQIWLNLSGTVMFHAGGIRMVVDCVIW